MCLVFASSKELDFPSRELLSRAYEAACDQLECHHSLGPATLGHLVDPMTTALLDLYRAGERDEEQLTHYAVSRALMVGRELDFWNVSCSLVA